MIFGFFDEDKIVFNGINSFCTIFFRAGNYRERYIDSTFQYRQKQVSTIVMRYFLHRIYSFEVNDLGFFVKPSKYEKTQCRKMPNWQCGHEFGSVIIVGFGEQN